MDSLITIASGHKIGVYAPAKVWGQPGTTSEQILIHPEARNVVCNGTVDRLDFAEPIENYQFMTRAGQLFIMNANEELLARFLFNSDNPITLAFADGAVQALYSATREISLGGQVIGTDIVPWSGTLIDRSNTSDIAEIEPAPVPPSDGVAPVAQSASVDGQELQIVFDEALDSSALPPASAFTVNVGEGQIAVSDLAVNNDTLTLNLEGVVRAGQAVSVTYADPSSGNDANAIQDAVGNDVADFTLTAANETNAQNYLVLRVIDLDGARSVSEGGHDNPLWNNYYDGISFYLGDHSVPMVEENFGTYNHETDATPTYEEWAAVIQAAVGDTLTVSVGSTFTAMNSTYPEPVTGKEIVISSPKSVFSTSYWSLLDGMPTYLNVVAHMSVENTVGVPEASGLILENIPMMATVTQSGVATPLDDISISGTAADDRLAVTLSLGNADFGILDTTASTSGAALTYSGDDLHTISGTAADVNSVLAGLTVTSSGLGAACLNIEVSEGNRSTSGRYDLRQQITLNEAISLEGFGEHVSFPGTEGIGALIIDADGGELFLHSGGYNSDNGEGTMVWTSLNEFSGSMKESTFTPTGLGDVQIWFDVADLDRDYYGVYLFHAVEPA